MPALLLALLLLPGPTEGQVRREWALGRVSDDTQIVDILAGIIPSLGTAQAPVKR